LATYSPELNPNEASDLSKTQYVQGHHGRQQRTWSNGMATGGKVKHNVHVSDDLDMMRHELMTQPVRRFDEGGQDGKPYFGNPNIQAQGAKAVANAQPTASLLQSWGDTLNNHIGRIINDPGSYSEDLVKKAQSDLNDVQNLHSQAFSDPKRPFHVTDQGAFNDLTDKYMGSLMSFAPVGMTKVTDPYAKEFFGKIGKFAKDIADRNHDMSHAEVMQRASDMAKRNADWNIEQKPELERKYGALEPARFDADNLAKKTNKPEVVKQRIKSSNEFLDQPTPAWVPPPPEKQAFDRSLIKDALEGFPGVEQSKFPRYQPAKADLSHVDEVYQDPVNRELIKKQITRGLPLGGETFYASLYPLKMAALERGIDPGKFEQFIYSTAPASARNSIMNEMAAGQFLRNLHAQGIPLTDENVTREMANFKKKYGVGLPLMPVHQKGVADVLENNLNLRDMSKADIPTNYKIPTYGSQKAGDFAKSWVGDVHEAKGETLGSRYNPYFGSQGGFGPTEYGRAENHMLDISNELGIPGGMAQAGRWFGGGELTGLKSPRGDALDLLEKQSAYTLNGMGIKPTPANIREHILTMIDTGRGELMPWFKKEGMPDLRTVKKKGGKVHVSNDVDDMRHELKTRG